MRRTLAALFAAVAFLAGPAFAQTAPAVPQQFADPACPKLAEVEAILKLRHETYVILDATDLLGVTTDGNAKIIVATVGKVVTIGYESAGCVVGPIGVAAIVPKVGV